MSFGVLDKVAESSQIDGEDEEYFAHYADAADVVKGYIMGTPVIALCGMVFIPSRNPEKLRVCPSCEKIKDALFLSGE
jgi:hypothetical protein